MFLRYLYFLFVLLFSYAGYGQLSKADKLYQQNRYIKAIPHYEKASRKEVAKQEALIKLADCYRHVNEYEKAEKAYKTALAINSKVDPDVNYNYAEASRLNFDLDIASYWYNKVIAVDNGKKYPLCFFYKAQILQYQGNYKEAKKWLRKFGQMMIIN